ncbi:lipoxygenase 6, chloroplastic-like [Cornus florida]|uniref:lipoxygenase 6, chloroplastic-like n=1 Tax=Cornus florida TaxID=4283 RepID=UPI00289B05B5|nr:lipoxygenase 6, chloroplastic-like [Cornus florida]
MLTAQPRTSPRADISATAVRQLTDFSGAGNNGRLSRRGTQIPGFRSRVIRNRGSVRAVISSGDNKTVESANVVETSKDNKGSLVSSSTTRGIDVRAVITIRKKMKEKLTDKIEDQWESFINGIGQGILLQLISEEIDPVTKSGKSVESYVRGWLPKPSNSSYIVEYSANFTVPYDFGCPGAIIITNFHGKEFYLLEIVIHGFDESPFFFLANTWIHSRNDNPESRIIFKNQAYLPSQTPPGLKDLRREDLLSIRGNGKGERKLHDRIYDYAPYNDLGRPDKSEDLVRPVLAGEEWPYPRRCRTGRPPTKSDPFSESRIEKPHPVYVPRDETFEEIKQNTFSAGRLKALLHNLIPSIAATLSSSDISFTCFSDIDKMYNDGVVLKNDEQEVVENQLLPSMVKQILTVGERLLKYEVPAIIKKDRFAWIRDNEFGRQTLAGVNPVNIELLKEFPIRSKLDPTIYGPPESAITKEMIEEELSGMSVEEAIKNKRLFILDYHDMLLPFIKKMNSLPGRKAYASRTIFFYSRAGNLRPIAIELSLPPTSSSPRNKRVFTLGHDATTHWIWKQAKAHVCSNDAGIHQLVNHWLRTHACMEPYIIATHRQLSSMHPIYKLLHPHMRYTLEINALARQSLINGGGIIEACFSPGKYAMELSSAAYKSMWRFDMEALPADLIRRGMAVEDPSMPCGVKLVIEDYPYAADGLLIWSAIKEWVESYVEHYYAYDSNSIRSDVELQAWWSEIKNKGHFDKRNEHWWPELNTKEDLSGILTIMIWIASGQHAAINFGQYPFGGYVPNRPTLMRKLIPREDGPEYEKFLLNPQHTFLSSLPTQLQATKVMAVQDTLSTHSADEEYLGQVHHLHRHWIHDHEILKLFEKFSSKLEEIEETINGRNKDIRLKNRSGAGVPPYELLVRSSGPGVTGRGIPNSISI